MKKLVGFGLCAVLGLFASVSSADGTTPSSASPTVIVFQADSIVGKRPVVHGWVCKPMYDNLVGGRNADCRQQ